MTETATEKMKKTGGAVRQHQTPAYRLIPAVLMKVTGEAMAEGAEKYNEGLFETNWKKGNEEFYAQAFDHVIEHLYKWWTIKTDPGLAEVLGYELDENHLGHAGAGLGFLAYGDVMGFFNAARDPGAPGYQYPFVPEDLPGEDYKFVDSQMNDPEDPGPNAISDLIEKGSSLADSSLAETDERGTGADGEMGQKASEKLLAADNSIGADAVALQQEAIRNPNWFSDLISRASRSLKPAE